MAIVFLMTLIAVSVPFVVNSQAIPSTRRFNAFGELVTLLVSHTFILFNMVSVEDNFTVGYWVIGVIALYCFICFALIMKNVF